MNNPQTSLTESNSVQVKVVANTADEAVKTIRERFGERAKVLSVNQEESGGLKRLLSKPRLEVIVEVSRQAFERSEKKRSAAEAPQPKSEATAPEAKAQPAPSAPAPEAPADPQPPEAEEAPRSTPIANLYQKSSEAAKTPAAGGYFGQFETQGETAPAPSPTTARASEAPLGSAANPVRRGTLDYVKRAISMLEAVGFDRALIERVRYDLDFEKLGDLPTMELYSRICDWLRSHYPNSKDIALGKSRAFIGSCGAGKTSALCKQLSADVFINSLEPSVLKVDSTVPNPSDGLEAFCEIMTAPLYRSVEEVEEVSDERPLFVDMPGVNFSDAHSVSECRETLDELGVEERILVINAAYESEMIAEALTAGERIGATRVVFTHLDETRRAGKLWKFLVNGRALPLFFSHGMNPAGDYTSDTFSYLLEKTFPQSRSVSDLTRAAAGSARTTKEVVEA